MIYRFIAYNLHYFLAAINLLLGGFLLLAIIGYDALDPSYNRACGDVVKNFAGEFGAYLADPLLQIFGISIVIFPIVFLCWAVRLLVLKYLAYFFLRLLATVASVALSGALFHKLFKNKVYSFGDVGGILGAALANNFLKTHSVIIVSLYLLLLLMLFFATGLKASLIMSIFNRLRKNSSLSVEEVITVDKKAKVTKAKSNNIVNKTKIYDNKFILPSVMLLGAAVNKTKKDDVSSSILTQNSNKLIAVLEDFGIYGKILAAHPGPVVTLYELEPAAGTKSSRVIGLADDIARSISAISARIAVIPGRNVLGIELPNINREIVYLKELLDSNEYRHADYKLPIVLGKDIGGRSVIVDLAKMPHLLVAGTTGSGKSVAINTMILSLVYKLTPAECRFIMIDPKMLELSVYDGIPHLLAPVVTDPKKAVVALNWVVKEMESRYRLLSQLGVRSISGYNEKISEAKASGEKLERIVQTGFDPGTGKPILEKIPCAMEYLSLIVVIVDEMADLMLVAGKDIESSVQRLAQMARAAGIHIIMATQRPSVDVITGVIKANFPTRISFQVTSRIDSRTILGEQGGAEQLLGMGDMLYMSSGSKIMRVHGPFVSDQEVEKIVNHLKSQGSPSYIEDITTEDEGSDDNANSMGEEKDELYKQAVEIVLRDRKVSTSYIQRCLKIGYNRAATIIERMEKENIISPANHAGKREIF
jgi:S-DNA-T family DNA segregation ATPase FtsK/SpoIIIE